jgi:hypothetical protein
MKVFTLFLFSSILFFSCKKSKETNTQCFSEVTTTRSIIDKPASIFFANNNYYIIEQSTIDIKLLPCNLPDEFKINGLLIKVSGEVKNLVANGPCCIDNFVITKITK